LLAHLKAEVLGSKAKIQLIPHELVDRGKVVAMEYEANL